MLRYPNSVLIVDDYPEVQTLITIILNKLGINIIWTADNGLDALDVYMDHQPELVLLDINMPEMDGLEVLTRLREKFGNVAVIMLTTEATGERVSECIKLGVNDFIRKDENAQQMEKVLKSRLKRFSSSSD